MSKKTLLLIILALMPTQLIAEAKKDGADLAVMTTEKKPADDVPTQELSNRAYETLKEEMFPATSDQLKQIQEEEREQQKTLYYRQPPKQVTKILTVSTEPGAIPVTVYVTPGRSTTLNVIDSTGQPWPLQAAMGGNADDYRISTIEQHAFKNIVRVDALRDFGSTNVILSLVGMSTTISVELVSSDSEYNPTPVLQIDKEGPQAKHIPVYTTQPILNDEILKKLVMGIAPSEFTKMKSSDKMVEAWKNKEGSLFIRTTLMPISPLPRTIYNGPNGYSAYTMGSIPLIICTDEKGTERKIYITD